MVTRDFAGKAAITNSALSGNVVRVGGVVIGPAPNPHARTFGTRVPVVSNGTSRVARRRSFTGKAATSASARAAVTTSTGGGIDLTVTNLTAFPVAPIAGQPVTFTVTVRNGGTAPVPAGRGAGQNIGVGLYLDGASTPVTFTNWDGGLAPGATFTLDTSSGWAPGGAWGATTGTHTVRAWVDDQNLISETNEANNTRDLNLLVTITDPAFIGVQLTPQQVFPFAFAAGFTTESQLLAITAIAVAESSLWTQNRNYHPEYGFRPVTDVIGIEGPANVWNAGHTQQLNSDRGLWQISTHSWPQYTDAQCDDPTQAAQAAYQISLHGTTFTPWDTFVSGTAQAHYDAAVGGWPALRPLVQSFLAAPPLGFRLYADTSPWNTIKSPSGPFFAGADSVLSTQTYGLNNDSFSHPFYRALASDPVWTIVQTETNWGWGPRTVQIHAPDGIAPASGSDSVMSILDIDGMLWDFYGVGGGVNQAAHTVNTPLLNTSNGITGRGFPDVGSTGFQTPGTSISGAPQASGTILASDVANGTIPHGLFMAFDCAQLGPGASGTRSVAPAMAGIDDIGGCPGLIPEGALLLAVGSEPAGLTAMEHQLWVAASTYGVYVCDRLGGHPQFYGDRSAQVGAAFTDVGLTAIGRKLRLVRTW